MAELKLYPVGIQTFEEIITRNLLYVDKTEYVYRMTHSGGRNPLPLCSGEMPGAYRTGRGSHG